MQKHSNSSFLMRCRNESGCHRHIIIQREAVGVRDHRDVDRLYQIPGPIKQVEGEK